MLLEEPALRWYQIWAYEKSLSHPAYCDATPTTFRGRSRAHETQGGMCPIPPQVAQCVNPDNTIFRCLSLILPKEGPSEQRFAWMNNRIQLECLLFYPLRSQQKPLVLPTIIKLLLQHARAFSKLTRNDSMLPTALHSPRRGSNRVQGLPKLEVRPYSDRRRPTTLSRTPIPPSRFLRRICATYRCALTS